MAEVAVASSPNVVALIANSAWNIYNFRRGVVRGLIQAGNVVVVIAPKDEYSTKLEALGCRVETIEMSARGVNPFADLNLLFALWRLFSAVGPSIVFNFTVKPNVFGTLAAALRGIPSVAVVTGVGYAFLNPGPVAAVARQLMRWSLRLATQVWFLNTSDREELVCRSFVRPERARLLPGEGIDLDHFSPRGRRPRDGTVTFLMVARALRDKGVREYVAAARALRESYPAAKFQLLGEAGGDNPSAISRAQVDEWHERRVIEYLGHTSDVRLAIANADCVVLPSYREGLSKALMEAAAMGKPIVASDVPGCREIVLDGTTGFLCRPADVNDLTAALARMASVPAHTRERMGDNGHRHVANFFGEARVVQQYCDAVATLAR